MVVTGKKEDPHVLIIKFVHIHTICMVLFVFVNISLNLKVIKEDSRYGDIQ